MRIVIVGGAGFIGTALATSMKQCKLQPVVLDTQHRLARSSAWLRTIDTVQYDFAAGMDVERHLAGADALVHLACTTTPGSSMVDISRDAQSNIVSSIRLFDACARAGVDRVVFASSGGTVYGAPVRLPVVETDAARPLSAYGVSKLAIENYLSLYSQFSGISLRVANPYGAYQLQGSAVGVIARYIMAVMDGRSPEVWGDGTVVRDYIAIEDVASAFLCALTSEEIRPGAYNVGSGVGRSISQVIHAIQEVAGETVKAKFFPGRPYDVREIVLDTNRLSKATGWSCKVPFLEGVARLWQEAGETSDKNRNA